MQQAAPSAEHQPYNSWLIRCPAGSIDRMCRCSGRAAARRGFLPGCPGYLRQYDCRVIETPRTGLEIETCRPSKGGIMYGCRNSKTGGPSGSGILLQMRAIAGSSVEKGDAPSVVVASLLAHLLVRGGVRERVQLRRVRDLDLQRSTREPYGMLLQVFSGLQDWQRTGA